MFKLKSGFSVFLILLFILLSSPSAISDTCYSYECGLPVLRETYIDTSCPHDPSEVCSYDIYGRTCKGARCRAGITAGLLHDCTLLQAGPGQDFSVLLENDCGTEHEVSRVYLFGVDRGNCNESKCFYNCDDGQVPYMELEDVNCPPHL